MFLGYVIVFCSFRGTFAELLRRAGCAWPSNLLIWLKASSIHIDCMPELSWRWGRLGHRPLEHYLMQPMPLSVTQKAISAGGLAWLSAVPALGPSDSCWTRDLNRKWLCCEICAEFASTSSETSVEYSCIHIYTLFMCTSKLWRSANELIN